MTRRLRRKIRVPYIVGDGVGSDIWRAALPVFQRAAEKYCKDADFEWFEVLAGKRAFEERGEWLPRETLEAIRECGVGIKGPLETPVGGGIRSLNVQIRQELDLYACVRPVRYFKGVSAPVRYPEKLNVVIFRENTEDVYAGIEWEAGSEEAEKIRGFLKEEMGVEIREDAGIGVKPISEFGTKRLVRMAIRYAIEKGRKSVTLVHKGNIMKFTEGAFCKWGYEVAFEEFGDYVVKEGEEKEGRIVIKDRIADNFFQQILTRPDEYDVIATMNLNGDYLSDACAAQVGGLGIAPGGNIGDGVAVFEATHGTAPKYAGLDKVNPTSLILSGAMMFDYLGFPEASRAIEDAVQSAILTGHVTYDLARGMEGAKVVRCSEFGSIILERL